jgi:hypothetical protein
MRIDIFAHWSASLNPRHATLAALVALLVLLPGAGVASAQSGPPPPPGGHLCAPLPGTVVVEPTYPAVPPAGVPPVVGPGALAVIPATPGGGAAQITAELGGCVATVIIPADPERRLAVRNQGGLRPDQMPSPMPAEIADAVCRFSVDVYDADSGQRVGDDLPSAISAGLVPGPEPGALVLMSHDSATRQYRTLHESLGPAGSVHAAMVGRIELCVQAESAGSSSTDIPRAMPATGGGLAVTLWRWGLAVMVVGLAFAGSRWGRAARREP